MCIGRVRGTSASRASSSSASLRIGGSIHENMASMRWIEAKNVA